MTNRIAVLAGLLVLLINGTGPSAAGQSEANAAPGSVQVHIVVTVEPLESDESSLPVLSREQVQVRQGKTDLPVTAWIPSRGEQAALQLFILIDDTSDTSLGLQLNDLREFIEAQPATTVIGLGYMQNNTTRIVQNFTSDHALVSKALRMPLGRTGASDSPYLSLIGVLKGWPERKARREVIMITDGIDRLRGAGGGSPPMRSGFGRDSRVVMPYISPDVDRASREAQKAGVIVHSIYTRGVGHVGRNFYEINNGQNGISKLADETGGESFMLGTQNAISFKPYMDRLQKILDNQYFLVFRASPGKKADLQRVGIGTEVPKLEIVSADNVWVPAITGG